MRALFLFFFFLSGACGLIYEIAWLRVLGLMFGNTTQATSTVLASYMGGLGVGALYFGKRADQNTSPIRLYAWLEGGIALYALLTPVIWKLLDWTHIVFYRSLDPSFLQVSLFKFGVAFTALFIPTFLMGGTLPILVKYFVRRNENTATSVATLYGLNTFGAVSGVLICGFFAMYVLGVWQTVILAGILNALICLFCVRLLKRVERAPYAHETTASVVSQAPSARTGGSANHPAVSIGLLILFGVSGAVSMMYEIGWTKILAIILGSSVYAFSIMLATFLLGISFGSYLFSIVSKRIAVNFYTFATLQFLTSLFALWGLNHFNDLAYRFIQVYTLMGGTAWLVSIGKFLLCALIMLPPTVMIGAMFSCFVEVYKARSHYPGDRVGIAYFSNTVGAILGSALTGFVVVPLIGVRSTLLVAAGLNALVGLSVLLLGFRSVCWRRSMFGVFLFGCVIASATYAEAWDPKLIVTDAAVSPHKFANVNRTQYRRALRDREVLFYEEGLSSAITVTQSKDRVALWINGKVDASNGLDAFTQFFVGHLPLLIHPKPEDVLVIGWGSGSTVAAVASHPVKTIDVVEMEQKVVDTSTFFSDLNRNVIKDPRVEVMINDGRNYLLVEPKEYDVIASEPSNPWMAGVANLFSYEHYQNMRRRLKPGGIVCQWLHAYRISKEDLRMIIRTFTDSFEHTTLWEAAYPDLFLIGSDTPMPIDFERFRKRFDSPQVFQDFEPYGFPTAEGIFGSFWLGDKALRQLAAGAEINSDNKPLLEFSAPKSLYQDEAAATNFAYLNSFWEPTVPPIVNMVPPPDKNIRFHTERARFYTKKNMARQAKEALRKAKQLDPKNADFLEIMGISSFQRGELVQAGQLLLAALVIRPNGAEAHHYLGRVLQAQKHNKRAAIELGKAHELAPNNPRYLRVLADHLSQEKQYALAVIFYSQLSKMRMKRFHALNQMTAISFLVDDHKQQQTFSDAMIQLYPTYRETYKRYGEALLARGQNEEALRVYAQLSNQYPSDPNAYVYLARVRERLGQPEEAKKALLKALRLEPAIKQDPRFQIAMKVLER